MKICKKCGIEKEFSQFYLEKNSKDGYRSKCKPCFNYYFFENKERVKEYKKKYAIENKELLKEKAKKYYQSNKEFLKNKRITYYKNNKEKSKKAYKIYYLVNKESIHKYRNNYTKERIKKDDLYKLIIKIRNLIKIEFLRSQLQKESTTKKILGCSFENFKSHLESKFEPWMNWSNHGICTGNYNETWQLDHIIPISSAKTENDLETCRQNRCEGFIHFNGWNRCRR